jgi:uncharacterized protein YjdB
MKKSLLFLLLLMPSAGRFLYAQVYEEDYKFPAKGNHYWTDHDVRNYCWQDMAGDMTLYTDDIYNCHAPLIIELSNTSTTKNAVWDYGFYLNLTDLSERSFVEYCDWWGSGIGSYWEYRATYVRLSQCTFGTYLKVSHHMPNYASFIFSYIKSLVGAEIEWKGKYSNSNVFRKMFLGCTNLKFVSFHNPNVESYVNFAESIFSGCSSLEVVRFTGYFLDRGTPESFFSKIFHPDFDKTAENSPKMKAFVVPDHEVATWQRLLAKAHKGVRDGWVKVIPESVFKSGKPQGLTVSAHSLELINPGSEHQLTATVSPSNIFDKTVLWSSDNPSVVSVSSTGVITARAAGEATVTATLKYDDRYKDSCRVTVSLIRATGVTTDHQLLKMLISDPPCQLTATVSPSNAFNKTVAWSSSDPSVVSVSATGLVTAKSLGTATVTVTTADGGHTAACTVMSVGVGGACGDNVFWTLTDSVLTISGSGAMYDFEASGNQPEGKGLPFNASINVTTPWYSQRLAINKIVVESGVTSIGAHAFMGLQNVRALVWHEGITHIGTSAFSFCEKLEELNIPDNLTHIREKVFYACRSLESITIPPNVAGIHPQAFQECTNATVLDIPASVVYIDPNAFIYCDGLTEVICRSLAPIHYVSATAFAGVDLSKITLWVPFRTIVAYRSAAVWKDFGFMTDDPAIVWTLKDSVLTVRGDGRMPDYGYNNTPWYSARSSVKKIVVEGFTSIGNYAFNECYNLSSLVLPHSITSIGDAAFCQAFALDTIVCMANTLPTVTENPFDYVTPGHVILIVPASAYDHYKNNYYWKNFNIRTPATGIFLGASVINTSPNHTFTMTATVSPVMASSKKVFWRSSDNNLATVTASGTVTTHFAYHQTAPWEVYIIAETEDGHWIDSCLVRIVVNTDASLQSVKIRSGSPLDLTAGGGNMVLGNPVEIPFTFDPNVTAYTIHVEDSVRHIMFTAEPTDPQATITGMHTDIKNPATGENIYTVTVTAEDRITQRTYEFKIVRKDIFLESLTLTGRHYENLQMVESPLQLSFDSERFTYNLDVSYLTTEVEILAEADFQDPGLDGTGIIPLEYGENTLIVHLTNNYDREKTYTLKINRSAYPGYLHNLTLNASVWEGTDLVTSALPLPFDKTQLNYDLAVSSPTDSVDISAQSELPLYGVKGTGSFPLNFGQNVFTVYVDANVPIVYTVRINRPINTYKQLGSLDCYPHSILPAYSPDIYEYTLHVGKTVDSIYINAVPVSPAALSGQTGAQRLNDGLNRFTFTVTAMDGGTSTYTLEVWREPRNSDAALSYLAVDPGYLSPSFDPEITSYSAEVENSVEEVIIDAELRSPTAKFVPGYDKPGKYPVKTGKNRFNFNVSTENSLSTNSYTLTVTRKGNTTNTARITRNIPTVGIRNGTIEINTPAAERINIYSVTGTLLYSFDKPAGAFTFHLSPFTLSPFHPSPVLIVKSSSGWSEKLVVSD